MKHRPDLDARIWAAAEGDAAERDRLLRAHPEVRSELEARAKLVGGLRAARPSVAGVPPFAPRIAASTPRSWRWIPLAASGLAAVAFGAYGVGHLLSGQADQKPLVAAGPAPTLPMESRAVAPDHAPTGEKHSFDALPDGVAAGSDTSHRKYVAATPAPPAERVVDVDLRDVRLADAIRRVASIGGYRVLIAPGFPATVVDWNSSGTPALETLRAMGDALGFTIFEQGPGELLAVPAVAREVPPAGGDNAIEGPEKAETERGP